MNIDKKDRATLKLRFVKNAIPTETDFADLIGAMVNQKDDGVYKPAGDPLCIEAAGGAEGQKKAIVFYDSFAGEAPPTWVLSLRPGATANDPNAARPGFAIGDGEGNQRLFIDKETGKVGLGTLEPADALDVTGEVRILSGSNPLHFTSSRREFAARDANAAQICNDTGSSKSLMIAGNRSAGGERRVTIWDQVEVKGSLDVKTDLAFGKDATRQMVALYGSPYGIGVQNQTAYFRTHHSFAWYRRGQHHDAQWSPGGGTLQMALDSKGNLGLGRVPDRKLAIERDGENTEFSLNDNLFLDGAGKFVRLTNNAFLEDGKWKIADPTRRAFALELRDNGTLQLLGTYTAGDTEWRSLAYFNARHNLVHFNPGISIQGNRTEHLESDGSFYRYDEQVYLTVDDNLYIRDMDGDVRFHFDTNSGLLRQQDWQAVTFDNNWENYSLPTETYNPAGYFKDSMGIVHLRGLVKGGSVKKAIFKLPDGYAPRKRELFACAASPNVMCRVDVDPNGSVVPMTGDRGWVSLDGLTFQAKE